MQTCPTQFSLFLQVGTVEESSKKGPSSGALGKIDSKDNQLTEKQLDSQPPIPITQGRSLFESSWGKTLTLADHLQAYIQLLQELENEPSLSLWEEYVWPLKSEQYQQPAVEAAFEEFEPNHVYDGSNRWDAFEKTIGDAARDNSESVKDSIKQDTYELDCKQEGVPAVCRNAPKI
ncbi:hypothetical protein CYLTODRAFT_454497 [Cylindrobasidium torrendii FP15055 ss-10]|uniref:Uncharacterized protein n=1 Tax=Cylindrobasidium torrendii FP15055 ss-10 TaxID=1314674 RepID=A0A0D7BCX2_9AGAR|nr:hypothetical protein CYLTODRAFT_454497 [Cylindrobasidium torrendii FP15055 ss-10]